MDKTTTIRVSQETYDKIKSIARLKNEKIRDVLEEAVKDYTKKQFFEDLNAAFIRLKSNPRAWSEEETERQEWDAASTDGLDSKDGD